MNWYLSALKKYAVFGGRARRKEFWYFYLFSFIIATILAILDVLAGTGALFLGIYYLATLIPTIAVSVRRLHDTDRSGWWILITLIPFIGGIVWIVFCAQESTHGGNRFGSNPISDPDIL